MSQWGAHGYAQHGWRWQQILAHYYPGTQPAPAPVSRVRVLLARRSRRRSPAPAGSGSATAPGAAMRRPSGEPIAVGRRRCTCREHRLRSPRRLRLSARTARVGRASVSWATRRAPEWQASFGRELASPRRLRARRRRRGDAAPVEPRGARGAGGRLAFLCARDVEARQALRPLLGHAQPGVWRHRRDSRTDLAVARTAGKVLMWNGHVATTFFFSTSGGRTADVRGVWPTLGAVPYLRSVADPYDAASPHHRWGPFTFEARRLAPRLHVPAGDRHRLPQSRRRVAAVRIGSRTVDGETFRSDLGLASTWFQIGSFRSPGRPRSRLRRKGTPRSAATGVGRARLQRRIGAGAWKTLKLVRGSEGVTVEPQGVDAVPPLGGWGHRACRRGRRRTAAPRAPGRAGAADRHSAARLAWGGHRLAWQEGGCASAARRERNVQRAAPVAGRGYRITVAGDGRFAAANANVRVTARLLSSLRH